MPKKPKYFVVVMFAIIMVMASILVACDNDTSLQDKINQLQSQVNDLQAKVNGYEADYSEKSITIFVGEKKFEMTTGKAFLHEALKDLYSQGQITAYQYGSDDLNPFISQIDDLMQDFANSKYYSLWHNVDNYSLKSVSSLYNPTRSTIEEDSYGTQYVITTYQGVKLYYASVGVGILPLVDGCTYAILVD